jgi:hypothetical protein
MENIVDSNGREIIVAELDSGKLSWKEAITICKELSNNWRLPTIEELTLIYNHRQKYNLNDFEKDIYWSSEPDRSYKNIEVFEKIGSVKTFDFGIGIPLPWGDLISNKNYVRLVRYSDKPSIFIKFEYRCRRCLTGSSVPVLMIFNENNKPFNIGHSEYYAEKKLKEVIKKRCDNCNSNDIEYFDISINEKKLFNENKYKSQLQDYFEIFIDNNNGNIEINTSGAKYFRNSFKQSLIAKLEDIKDEYSKEQIESLNHGNFHFCFRGFYNGDIPVYRIERMLNSGIPYIELEKIINKVIKFLTTR